MPNDRNHVTNVVFVGEACSGKTALLYRVLGFKFPKVYEPTVGYRSFTQKITDSSSVHYDDSAGKHSLKSESTTKFLKADIIVCTVDLTNNLSLDNMHHHIRHAVEASKNQNVRVLVVATKADLEGKRIFNVSTIETRLKENNIAYESVIPTSAKTGYNIDLLEIKLHGKTQSAIDAVNKLIQDLTETSKKNLNAVKLCNELRIYQEQIYAARQLNVKTGLFHLKRLAIKKTLLNRCDTAVINAINAFTNSSCDEKQKKAFLKELNDAASALPSVKKLKALAICMMAIGAILATIGIAATLISTGAIATGVLAPLGVLGVAGGACFIAGGGVLMAGGLTLFAARHKLRNPLENVKKIGNTLAHY